MTDKQINEIMALVERYGVNCWNDGGLAYDFENDDATKGSIAAIESALRAVPDIPEVSPEWFALLAEARQYVYDEEGYCIEPDLAEAIEAVDAMLSASPQAPQPAQPEQPKGNYTAADVTAAHTEGYRLGMAQAAQPRKPLFEDLIARHPGLSGELSAMDAQPDWTEQTR
jgi:hypothetical protein